MIIRKKSVAALVAAGALVALPGTAFGGNLSNECNSTTGGLASGTGANGTVHGTVCNEVKDLTK